MTTPPRPSENEPNGSWRQIAVGGHRCDLYEPTHPGEHGYFVIYLHGLRLGRLNENAVFSREFARHGLRVVAPMTGRSWWTDRICREFDANLSAERYVVERVLPFLAEQFRAVSPRLALLGTSMGGQGALRLAFKYPNQFPVAAAIAPAIDYHQRFYDEEEETLPQMYVDAESARQDTAILHVHPLNWPRNLWFASDPVDVRWHESAQKLRMKLSALGIPHECDLQTSGGGHSWDYYNLVGPQAIDFIIRRLEHERLRVV
jgi:S-formylglutathione hydrolase FrmB